MLSITQASIIGCYKECRKVGRSVGRRNQGYLVSEVSVATWATEAPMI